MFGDLEVPLGEISNDKIRIIGGNLTVNGTVTGTITLVGGDVFINGTAIVKGKIIAIGGSIHTDDGAQISGSVIETNLKEGLVYREYDNENIVEGDSDFDMEWRSERARSNWLFPDFPVVSYNRNEGFVLSPLNSKWDRGGKSQFRLNLNLGYRFGSKDWIGNIGFERGFGANKNIILFINGFKKSMTDDGYRLHTDDNTAAGIFGRQDFFDRWDEKGVSGGIGLDLSIFKLKMAWTSVEQDTLPITDLWSLFEKNRPLRPNLNIVPGKAEYVETTIATRSTYYSPHTTSVAMLVNISSYYDNGLDINPIGDHTRVFGLGVFNWEFSSGLMFRNRTIVGTSSGILPVHRLFGVGGYGSVNAYPYKVQVGNQLFQTNLALVFTSEFIDHGFDIYTFVDAGHAWDKQDYALQEVFDHYDSMIKSVGIGVDFVSSGFDDDDYNFGFSISKPIDGPDQIETVIRLGYIF